MRGRAAAPAASALLAPAWFAAGLVGALGLAGAAGPSDAAGLPGPPPARPASTPGPHAWMREGYVARFTGKPAPDFALRDLQGVTHRLSSLRGTVVLLNFWYSSCVPCRRETPDLIALHRSLGGRGLVILGINMDDVMIPQAGGRERERFLAAFPVPYPVLLADQKVMNDYGEIPVQPISFLVDAGGRVARVFWGAFPGEVYERAIRPLLDAHAPPRAATRPGR